MSRCEFERLVGWTRQGAPALRLRTAPRLTRRNESLDSPASSAAALKVLQLGLVPAALAKDGSTAWSRMACEVVGTGAAGRDWSAE